MAVIIFSGIGAHIISGATVFRAGRFVLWDGPYIVGAVSSMGKVEERVHTLFCAEGIFGGLVGTGSSDGLVEHLVCQK
jgi:hypothetical protein